MKKTLVAIAAMCAAGAASAQSGVQLFGVVDIAVQRIVNGGTGSSTRLGSGSLGSSRLNFSGREDLGGGWAASFSLEGALAADAGTGTASNTNNQTTGTSTVPAGTQGFVFNRQSTVSLHNDRLGEIKLGREVALHSVSLVRYDPFRNSGVGVAQPFVQMITGPTAYRTSNTVHYALPNRLGGFFGDVAVFFGENASNAVSGTRSIKDDGNGTAVRFGYRGGPVEVAASWGKTKFAAGDAVQSNIGGTWEFGFARAYALIERDKIGTTDARGWVAGAAIPAFQVGEFRVSTSGYEIEPLVGTERKAKKLALGYHHHLSKRTSIYTNIAQVRNSGGNASSVLFQGPAPSANQRSKAMEMGLRHVF